MAGLNPRIIYFGNINATGTIRLRGTNNKIIHERRVSGGQWERMVIDAIGVSLEFGDLVSEQNPDGTDAIRIKATVSDVDVVIGHSTGYFSVYNAADNNAVFYVNDRGNTVIAGDLIVDTDTLFVDAGNNRVSIGTASPATSAKLDFTSTTGALLVPRMTTAQRDALTAVNGMIIYNSQTNAFNFYENGAWVTGSGLA